MIDIFLNNQTKTISQATSLSQLLADEKIDASNIAIAINNQVIQKNLWDSQLLQQGDRILIIKAFYGG